jgi:hypothetical protein
MQMIDVMKKLQEIAGRSPETEHALDNLSRMNAPTNVAEGIEIKTTGDDAILAQILKLAGMAGGVNSPDMSAAPGDMPGAPMGGTGPDPFASDSSVGGLPAPVDAMSPGTDDMEMDILGPGITPSPNSMEKPEEPKLPKFSPDFGAKEAAEGGNRPYTNSPNEVVKGIKAAVPSGNDLAKPKLTAPKVAGGDNPTHVAVSFD